MVGGGGEDSAALSSPHKDAHWLVHWAVGSVAERIPFRLSAARLCVCVRTISLVFAAQPAQGLRLCRYLWCNTVRSSNLCSSSHHYVCLHLFCKWSRKNAAIFQSQVVAMWSPQISSYHTVMSDMPIIHQESVRSSAGERHQNSCSLKEFIKNMDQYHSLGLSEVVVTGTGESYHIHLQHSPRSSHLTFQQHHSLCPPAVLLLWSYQFSLLHKNSSRISSLPAFLFPSFPFVSKHVHSVSSSPLQTLSSQPPLLLLLPDSWGPGTSSSPLPSLLSCLSVTPPSPSASPLFCLQSSRVDILAFILLPLLSRPCSEWWRPLLPAPSAQLSLTHNLCSCLMTQVELKYLTSPPVRVLKPSNLRTRSGTESLHVSDWLHLLTSQI